MNFLSRARGVRHAPMCQGRPLRSAHYTHEAILISVICHFRSTRVGLSCPVAATDRQFNVDRVIDGISRLRI